MNRQIKFRGKSADGKWHYGDLLHIDGGTLIYHGSNSESDDLQGSDEVAVELLMNEVAVCLPDTIGQFTGLTDENGTEIYEGDVLIIRNEDYSLPEKVIFEDGCFEADDGLYKYDFSTIDTKYRTVIGNIHDAPKYSR